MTTPPDDFDKRLFLLPKSNSGRPSSYRAAHALACDLLHALRVAQAKLKEPGK